MMHIKDFFYDVSNDEINLVRNDENLSKQTNSSHFEIQKGRNEPSKWVRLSASFVLFCKTNLSYSLSNSDLFTLAKNWHTIK